MPRAFGGFLAVFLVVANLIAPAVSAEPRTPGEEIAAALEGIDRDLIETGILYDRVVPLSRIDEFDGTSKSPPISLRQWKQIYFEMSRASLEDPAWIALDDLERRAARSAGPSRIPIAFMNFKYNRIRAGAFDDGSLVMVNGRVKTAARDPFDSRRVFAASALKDYTHRGGDVDFVFDADFYVSNDRQGVASIEVDFDDGTGFRPVAWDGQERVSYASQGTKTIRTRAVLLDGTVLHSDFAFHVENLVTPDPNDTLSVMATIPYEGGFGTGEAYVYLGAGHTTITNPVVVIEGFDLDNTMNWDELYDLLNQENLIETLRAKGFDAVVMNFTDATDFIQRNSFAVIDLLEQVESYLDSYRDIALIGASMGGLCGRYALSYMETNGLGHEVRTFISFDGPQGGANIPLGMQYWLDFFSGMSDEAGFLLSRLDTPAARQMLVYHHTTPPGATGDSDALRAALLADFEAAGGYPTGTRNVAVANGSGFQAGQGFEAGAQLIDYVYTSFLVDITGNVWAVPDASSQMIFDGLINIIILPTDELSVTVGGTLPYDNAPGGRRNSMAQMDSTEAPYGDIIALHDGHCFIPTVSALGLTTSDLFFDIAGHPDILSLTPFDAVYYPAENQAHVSITAESAVWFIDEIESGVTSIPSGSPRFLAVSLSAPAPNPVSTGAIFHYTLAAPGAVEITVHDVKGRRVATLLKRDTLPAGEGSVRFDASYIASGVYFAKMKTSSGVVSQKIAVIR